MNILDMRSIFTSYVISSVISMAVIASLWSQNRRLSPGLVFWLADFIMQFMGLLLVLLRGTLPDFFSMVVSNTLIVGGTLLLLIGLERYLGKPGPQWHNHLYLGAFIVVQIYFTSVQPSLQARNINISVGIFILSAQCAWLLLRRADPEIRLSTRSTGAVFFIICLVNLVRIYESLAVLPNNDFFKSGLYDALLILSYQMLYIGLTFALVLMVNRRLLKSLESDIVERKRMEETLRVSEEKFSIAFQTSPYAITITRAADGKFLEINDSFTALTGIPREEALADSSLGLNLWVNVEDRQRVVAALRSGAALDWQEFQFRKKDGGIITGLFSARLIQLSQVPCILSSINDISERKRMEQKLQESNFRLEEAVSKTKLDLHEAQDKLVRQERLAVMGQLAGSVGHELRNPLGVISNAVYFLKLTQPEASGKVKEYLDLIESEIRISDKIVTDLLDFSRVKSADRQVVEVSKLVGQTLERFPAPGNVTVKLDLPGGLPPVFADPQQMMQVLANLTINACQAMPEGGVLTVSGEPSPVGGWVLVRVKDTGIGIPPENLQKLFEPLFTTKMKGIGLGLAVSKRLAEANGGRLEVESQPGVGSTFTLVLPQEEAQP
jgi:PAS domain S-box-containing protein